MSRKTPRPDQAERIERFLAEPTKAALIADEPGIGKTVVGAEIAVLGGFERVLIVGVKDTYGQWRETVLGQSDGELDVRRIDSTKAGRQAFADFMAGVAGIFFSGSQFLVRQDWRYDPVTNADGSPKMVIDKKTGMPTDKQESERVHLMTYKKMKRPVDLFIFDEAHVIANKKSIGRRTVMSIPAERKTALSGTPGGNSFEGLWSLTRWLWPELIPGSFYAWRDKWCTTEDLYVGRDKPVTVVTGERVPGAFVASLPCYFRAEAPPVPAPKVVWVDLDEVQRAQYDALAEDMILWVGENALVPELTVTQRQMLRTATLGTLSITEDGKATFDLECSSSKLNALAGLLRFYGDQPVIIGVDRKVFADVAAERMRRAGFKAVAWTGSVSSKERDQIKADFLAGRVQYIVATISSMSTGLDGFQDVCSKLVWLDELEGNPSMNEQFVRRLWRPPYSAEFEQVKILARDTWDDEIYVKNMMSHVAMKRSLKTPHLAA